MGMIEKRPNESSRDMILRVAAGVVHENGFRATGINEIVTKTGLTKGAFYHHFKSKSELGLAVADEIIAPMMKRRWNLSLEQDVSGVDQIRAVLEGMLASSSPEMSSKGCPLINLANEMSSHDEKICKSVKGTIEDWRVRVETALQADQANGLIRGNIDCEQISYFILAAFQGAVGLAKPYQDPGPFRASIIGLLGYLDSLSAKAA